MAEILLSAEQVRQVRRLRFDAATEEAFQRAAADERLRRIQAVMALFAAFTFLAPPIDFGSARSTWMDAVNAGSNGLVAALLISVFVPAFRRHAVFALPAIALFQQIGFGLSAGRTAPFGAAAILLCMNIIVLGAVRAPLRLAAVFTVITVSLRVATWNYHGFALREYLPALMVLVFGSTFLVLGALLTESSDRRSFLLGRSLEEEREKTQSLLSNVLPAQIAEKLKHSAGVIAELHPSATILFIDIVNFTPFASEHSPAEVVGFLNRLFSRFDELVQRFGLEKIKTMGDGYIVAGGLPTFREDHLVAVADLALEMRGTASALGVDIRLGMHTGPVIAGVIGTKKYMYDIWGPTVNMAARLEAAGSAGEILVSQVVRESLQTTHECRERGSILLKGIGEVPTFTLVRRLVEPVQMTQNS